MSLSDPIGDMLARIKNAQMRNHKKVALPSSKFKTKIADVLKSEGFIIDYKIIDDANSKTILSASSNEKDMKSASKVNKIELSKLVAEKLAKKAVEKNIKKIYFDRGQFKYHGRVKIFAETLRKNGMEF